ncbi:MAG: hypothetical protein R2799_06270 [Crocinitomicaceae bacterium]
MIRYEDPADFHRYFYTFVKFLSLAGYTVYFPDFDFNFFKEKVYQKHQESWNYYNLVYKEGLLVFGAQPKKKKVDIDIDLGQLDANFFKPYFMEMNSEFIHIPMSLHPQFYHLNLWNTPLDQTKTRRKSVFMVGNFTREHYSGFEKTPFQMPSRVQVVDHLKNKNLVAPIDNTDQLSTFLSSESDHQCIILDSKKTPVPIQELRQRLNQFYFYLVLPGVIMPFSHNVIECLSAGTIPIIHKEYANLFTPQLTHLETALIFEDLEDLENKIHEAYQMDRTQLDQMVLNIEKYYSNYLTPEKVVELIENNPGKKIFLQAEHLSVKKLEESLA